MSFIDVLRGDEATLTSLKGKKIIVGGTALELGDRFSVPNGGIVSGPVLQALAAESIIQNRALHWTSDAVTAMGLCILALVMVDTARATLIAGIALLVILRHHDNIRRLVAGTESRVSFGKG